jgi:hypothetical protein
VNLERSAVGIELLSRISGNARIQCGDLVAAMISLGGLFDEKPDQGELRRDREHNDRILEAESR